MSILLNGNCLELLDTIDDNSIDLIYCDLPYATDKFGGCTSCEWDKPIDLEILWSKIMKKKKPNTPIFMSCNVKLGYELIRTAPKKCPFRYDLIWVKSSPAGFLNAKKMPMRKHELIYVFYEKLPMYDLSSHKHKFLKEGKKSEGDKGNECYGKFQYYNNGEKGYDPPLPNSVIKGENNTYNTEGRKKPITREPAGKYDPPLPDSVIKEELDKKYKNKGGLYSEISRNGLLKAEPHYDPPLPNSLLEVKSTRGKHSTEKPVDLIKWLLKYYTKEGDIVLDPTMGSGSTGVACKEMKRDFIGMELNPEIYEIAVNRIEV